MQNAALAQIFTQIASYLELEGDNIFKIRAYKTAAEAISDFPAPIENADLEKIEGLGTATIAKSREFFATGQVRVLENLKEKYPAGLLEVLRVPGLGPKKVALLYKEKGVDSLPKFAELLENDGLVGVAGFGAKTIENLKTNLRRLSELSSRLPLPEATELATKILDALQEKLPNVEIEIAGSLRRGAEAVSNLNFAVNSDDDEKVFAAFESLGLISEIVTKEAGHIVGRAAPGIEIELATTPANRWGFLQFFLTGSREHTTDVIQSLALEQQDFPTEKSVYDLLQVPYIAPELREGKGEWQAAKDGKLPDLLKVDDIRGDLHTHSTWSDGVASIRQMAQHCTERGYEYFCVTDHSKALAMANGLNAERLRQQAKEIAEIQAEFPNLKIFRGIECDILRDGTMDLEDDVLAELDFVVGSVHSGFNLPLEEQTARMVRAIQNPNVDLIGHPTGRVLGARAPYDVDVFALIEAAKKSGCALEINASQRLDLKDEYAFAAREQGVLLSIDTDAHSPRMLENLAFGVAVARRAWCEKGDILNAKSRVELERWLVTRK